MVCIVVVGQTVMSVSSKTLVYDSLCILEIIVHGIDDCYELTQTFEVILNMVYQRRMQGKDRAKAAPR